MKVKHLLGTGFEIYLRAKDPISIISLISSQISPGLLAPENRTQHVSPTCGGEKLMRTWHSCTLVYTGGNTVFLGSFKGWQSLFVSSGNGQEKSMCLHKAYFPLQLSCLQMVNSVPEIATPKALYTIKRSQEGSPWVSEYCAPASIIRAQEWRLTPSTQTFIHSI